MIDIQTLTPSNYDWSMLDQLHKPPSKLYIKGQLHTDDIIIAIVGSRKHSNYGKAITEMMVRGLRGQPITILSGLALGMDSIAHQAALDNKIHTAAVLPCGIAEVYPATHSYLAKQILRDGGALLSEYPGSKRPHRNSFVERNRIVAGLADAIYIPEAAVKSGTSHTVSFALELGIPILASPGPITSATSAGTNRLLANGATPILEPGDILTALGLSDSKQQTRLTFNSELESQIYRAIAERTLTDQELFEATGGDARDIKQALTMLELEGVIGNQTGQWYIK
ncbi:MAG: DNA-processing protein DprA [Patescibacteria group bacterium]